MFALYAELECGPMPNVMAALPNIGGALCSTPRQVPCNNAVNIGERKTWTQSEFSPAKFRYGSRAAENEYSL